METIMLIIMYTVMFFALFASLRVAFETKTNLVRKTSMIIASIMIGLLVYKLFY